MSSSVSELASGNGDTVQAPIVSEATMMQLLPPPYDLVKVDIEGSEFEFFQSYPTILKETRYLLLEWHSWHKGGGGGDQIRQLAFDCGFELVGEPVAQHQVSIRGKTEDCGTILLKRRS